MLYERRESDLGPKLWLGAEIEADPAVVSQYEEAPDLPGPIQAVGSADGPVTKAWCPQCQEVITDTIRDEIIAVSPITVPAPRIMWPAHKAIAGSSRWCRVGTRSGSLTARPSLRSGSRRREPPRR